MKSENYYIGLDIGTDSVGYAVTDTSPQYGLMKFSGEPMWGVTLFDTADLCKSRRMHRTERRRIDRKQQRITLLRELFAEPVSQVDAGFYNRITESALLRIDAGEPFCLFNDPSYTDSDYHKEYPTIHHLIVELMESNAPHDVRLVYIACAWLIAHRGHFLSDISIENVDGIISIKSLYDRLIDYLNEETDEIRIPRTLDDDKIGDFEEILKKKGVNRKLEDLQNLLNGGKKFDSNASESFPFSPEGIMKLLCGGSYPPAKLFFGKDEYGDLGNLCLDTDEETFTESLAALGDDGELIRRLKEIFDRAVLADLLNGCEYISPAKVKTYDRHKEDLDYIRHFVSDNYPKDVYRRLFRRYEKDNYVAYSGNTKNCRDTEKYEKCHSRSDFCKHLMKVLELDKDDRKRSIIDPEVLERIENGTFMPKQVSSENSVIPYLLYYVELRKILENASAYLPFLNEKDADGYVTKEKILSIMRFRIPYYVGPLNRNGSEHAWIERKADGRIYPWNFDEKVDTASSEEAFIKRMTNKCTYLAGEDVMPKNSLLYKSFEVLNEINCLKINGVSIGVAEKQLIFDNLFMKKKKVTPKKISDYLVQNNLCSKEDAETLSGIDSGIKSSLTSRISFNKLLESGVLSEADVEKIILRMTYAQDKNRFRKWLGKNYPGLGEKDSDYICKLSFKDFGRLSKALLNGITGQKIDSKTGEVCGDEKTVIRFMWESNVTLSELLLSDRYTFAEQIRKRNADYYSEHPKTLDERLDEMYISNAVKRPIIRTLDVVNDIVKATGHAPEKIFIEMARGGQTEKKRTTPRKQQLLDLYNKIEDKELSELVKELKIKLEGESENRLQSDKLFLFYTQLGRCIYSGEEIILRSLMDENSIYDIDHIYPQSKVKDDSILNNRVLSLKTINKNKDNEYPIKEDIRSKMHGFWEILKKNGLIGEEKYRRLTRSTVFSDEEKWGFINRQLVETRQSTKAVASLLSEKYPDTETVYVKAGLVSDFRQEFNLPKSRALNDLHHAKDAYLNIVCGNVYHEHFTKQWFLKHVDDYNVKTKKLFGRTIAVGGKMIWEGGQSLDAVKKSMRKNNCHMTFYPIKKKHGQNGGFFDQNPLPADKNLFPRKKGLSPDKYGGYNSLTTAFSVIVRYTLGKKDVTEFVPVTLLCAEKFMSDRDYALNGYIKEYFDKKFEEKAVKPKDVRLLFNGRPIKIGTELILDGLSVLFGSQGSAGYQIGVKVFSPLILPEKDAEYVKAVESFVRKTDKNRDIGYSQEETVSAEKNLGLFDLLVEKYGKKPYSMRPGSGLKKLTDGRDTFTRLDVTEQCRTLMSILSHFNRTALADTNLGLGCKCLLNANINIWKYSDVRIVDRSASGLRKRESVNLKKLS